MLRRVASLLAFATALALIATCWRTPVAASGFAEAHVNSAYGSTWRNPSRPVGDTEGAVRTSDTQEAARLGVARAAPYSDTGRRSRDVVDSRFVPQRGTMASEVAASGEGKKEEEPTTTPPGPVVSEPAPAMGADAAPGTYLTPNLAFPGLRRVHDNPPIYEVDAFLTKTECETLMEAGRPHLSRSVVVGGKDGTDAPRVSAPTRTSSSYFFPKHLLGWLNDRVAALTNKPVSDFEPPQIAKYTRSQFYAPHFDAFDDTTGPGRECIATGGQRVATVLIYLNPVNSGGGTYFPTLKQRFMPKQGKALVFFPCTLDGKLDKLALHTGEEAVDEKWVSQIWIRQFAFG